MKNDKEIEFPGFPPEREDGKFWCYPSVMDNFWCYLSGSEQKVLTFILRRTWGFNKNSDSISLSQFENGVGKIDKGTGLSRKQILRALKSLANNKFIIIEKTMSKTNKYRLVVSKVNSGSDKASSGSGDKLALSDSVKSTQTINNNNTINNNTINEINEIYDFYSDYICSKSRLTNGAKKKIETRLKEYSMDELIDAIMNFSRDNWWMTHNAHRGVAWFFHSEDRIDQFLNLKPFDRKEKLNL